MKKVIGSLCLSVLCVLGCGHGPVTGTLAVPDAPQVAYRKALRATQAVGGTIRSQDSATGTISATVSNVVPLNVSVQPQAGGSVVDVQSQVPANQVVIGHFSLVDDWLKAYGAQKE